jgi:universal stress protein A
MPSESSREIILFHVIQTVAETEDAEFADFYAKLKARAARKLDTMLREHESESAKIQQEIVFGNRVREIVTYARDQEVDLIILSSHPINPQAATGGWATISYRVGILAHCPVMMVK